MHDDGWQGIARAQPVSLTGERVIAQIKALAYDVEELLKATADQTGVGIAAARARAEASLRRAQEDVAQAGREAVRHARAVDHTVREHPWEAACIALTVGFALGCLGRRR